MIATNQNSSVPLAPREWTDHTLDQEEKKQKTSRTDINKYNKDIKAEINQFRTNTWNSGLEKDAHYGRTQNQK